MIGFTVFGVLATVFLLVFVANSRWAANKGWVYNKHNPRPRGSGIPPGVFDQLFQPSVEHVIEQESSERIRAYQDESGDKTNVN
ncbi:MAG: hypothetical protein ACC658_07905 [Acidimicrobiia bacterium]